jgi:hypothetical protein
MWHYCKMMWLLRLTAVRRVLRAIVQNVDLLHLPLSRKLVGPGVPAGPKWLICLGDMCRHGGRHPPIFKGSLKQSDIIFDTCYSALLLKFVDLFSRPDHGFRLPLLVGPASVPVICRAGRDAGPHR